MARNLWSYGIFNKNVRPNICPDTDDLLIRNEMGYNIKQKNLLHLFINKRHLMKNNVTIKTLMAGLLTISLMACQSNSGKQTSEVKNEETSVEKDTLLEQYGINTLSDYEVGGLQLGDIAADFSALTVSGDSFSLSKTLESQKVLIVFYRGYWCGYCQKHLSELEEYLSLFTDRGIKVVAITPESPEYAMKSVEKSELSLDIIPDSGYEIMKKYNVLFEVNQDYLDKLAKYEIDYDTDPETGKTFFPLPATYLVGKDGKIKFVHFDPDYSKRSDLEALLRV